MTRRSSAVEPSTMYVHWTTKLLALAALLAACAGGVAATSSDAPSAAGAGNVTVDHGDGVVTLPTGPNATVTGETTLDPGTDLTVVLRSTTPEHPFLRSNGTTVGEDGRFAATLDLSDASAGTNATLSIRADGTKLATVPARLVAGPTPTPTASPTATGSPTDTSSGDGAGFGVLASLVAAAGAALLVRRTA